MKTKTINLLSFAKGGNDVLPPPIFYKNQGEPDPPGYQPGVGFLFVNVSEKFCFDSRGNSIEVNPPPTES